MHVLVEIVLVLEESEASPALILKPSMAMARTIVTTSATKVVVTVTGSLVVAYPTSHGALEGSLCGCGCLSPLP